jgi:hypothetical protein
MKQSGTYTVGVTSFGAKEIGSYSVLYEIQAAAPVSIKRPQFGELGVRDMTRMNLSREVVLASNR